MSRSLFSYLIISFKGMAMGAADVVPGVSGGTVAFISGIYEELLTTIDNLNLGVLKKMKQDGFKAMWSSYNLGFLFSLFLGVLISIFSLAKIISYLLETYPIMIWSFFFGLVVASVLYIGKQINRWNIWTIAVLLIGILIAYYVTIAVPAQAPDTIYFFFISGCIAIIAMILPGISGSFILVILGSYGLVLGSLTDFINGVLQGDWDAVRSNFFKVSVFILGCVVGLKVFSKALKWMFAHQKNLTLAILTGFMIGSLNRIWPWQEVVSTTLDRHGVEVPLKLNSVLPTSYNSDPQIVFAISCAIIGFGLILLLERFANGKKSYAGTN